MKRLYNSIFTIVCAAGVAVCATSCLDRVFAESEPTLSTDVTDFVIGSDDFAGAGILNDTIYVTSNRSWSATLVDNPDWISLDNDEYLNISKNSVVFPLVIRFTDNKAEEPRYATLRITTEFATKDVKITQGAIDYRLVLDKNSDPRLVAGQSCYTAEVSPEEDNVLLAVNCNMPWTVRVLDDATASIILDKTEGDGIENLNVTFRENSDRENIKHASLLISAKGSDDLKVVFTQGKSVPYARVIETYMSRPSFPSIGGRALFTVKNNAPYTVRVKAGQEIGGGIQQQKRIDGIAQVDELGRKIYEYVESASFARATKEFTVGVFGNPDPDNDKSITFELIPEENEAYKSEITVPVDKLSDIFLSGKRFPHTFTEAGSAASRTYNEPFPIDLWPSAKCPSNNPEIEAFNGMKFRFHTFGTCFPEANPTARVYMHSKGIYLGSGYHYTMVSIPAVPGKRLARVTVSNTSSSVSTTWLKYGIVPKDVADKIASFELDADAEKKVTREETLTTVSGGEFKYLAPPIINSMTYNSYMDDFAINPESCHTFELSDTQVGAEYALVCLYSTGFRWLEFEYR